MKLGILHFAEVNLTMPFDNALIGMDCFLENLDLSISISMIGQVP